MGKLPCHRCLGEIPPVARSIALPKRGVDHLGLESMELTVRQMGIGSVPPNDADHVTGVSQEVYLRKLPATDGYDILESRHGEAG